MSFLSLFGSFFKKLFSGDLTTVFITVMLVFLTLMAIPTVSKVAGFFGYETKEVLREKLNTEKRNTAVLKDVVENQKTTIQIVEKTAENVVETLDNKVKNDVKTAEVATKIKVKRTEKILEIEKLDIPAVEKIELVSEVNITSIWEAYCNATPDPECQIQLQKVAQT